MAADVNGDGKINGRDIEALVKALWKHSRDLRYDVNGDGKVNWQDIKPMFHCLFNQHEHLKKKTPPLD